MEPAALPVDDVVVAPRVLSPWTGEKLLLADAVRELAADAPLVWLLGGPGSGKSTALASLAGGDRTLLDEPAAAAIAGLPGLHRVVVAASAAPDRRLPATVFRLAPWTADEWLEYLQARHRDRCGAVLRRLAAAGATPAWLVNAELCRAALDQLAARADLRTPGAALRAAVLSQIATGRLRRAVARGCLRILDGGPPRTARVLACARRCGGTALARLLRHRPVQQELAVHYLATVLRAGALQRARLRSVDEAMLQALATRLGPRPDVLDRLAEGLRQSLGEHVPLVVSLLSRVRPGWRPDPMPRDLAGALLGQARWDGAGLAHCVLDGVDFTGADLTGASLEHATARHACFQGARLRGARLQRMVAPFCTLMDADLSAADAARADLRHADLTRARCQHLRLHQAWLRGATLTDADLTHAELHGADLRAADLAGTDLGHARFARADLSGNDLRTTRLTGADLGAARLRCACLEGVELPRALLRGADLQQAGLTGSVLRRADLRAVSLRHAEMAEVDWEGADLRGACFVGASFHMGSTRGGLVFSATPGEGSRTGFYTEDLRDQQFRPPEAIRRANLCGTDLRGAEVHGVDFYLVDLRGARLDGTQVEWLRRCGAILA